MSVLSSLSVLGQQRIDVAQLRQIDVSVQGDVDAILGNFQTGNTPVIINGFTINLASGPIGLPAIQLQLLTAGSALLNPQASAAGTIFVVPNNRSPEVLSPANTNVNGSFAANSTNYIGLDLLRTADPTTSDTTSFLASNTDTEIQKIVPTARTLNYSIVISSTPFSANPNLCPVAEVVTDGNFNVISITDCRPILWRLGSGGDVPNWLNFYSFNSGRIENPVTITTNPNPTNLPFVGANPFTGGDKQLLSMKDWMAAVMTRIWEIGGGPTWYSPSASRFKKLIRLTPPSGLNFQVVSVTSTSLTLGWQSLAVLYDDGVIANIYKAPIQDNYSVGLTIPVGSCLYVDLDEYAMSTGASFLIAHVATLSSLMISPPPFPHGTRFIIAWVTNDPNAGTNAQFWTTDSPFPTGSNSTQAATTTTLGTVLLNTSPLSSSSPYVAVTDHTSDVVIATGISRGLVNGTLPEVGAGTLTIGNGFYDSNVSIIDNGGLDNITLNGSVGSITINGGHTLNLTAGISSNGITNIASGTNDLTLNLGTNNASVNIGNNSGTNTTSISGPSIYIGTSGTPNIFIGNNTASGVAIESSAISAGTAAISTSLTFGNLTSGTSISLNAPKIKLNRQAYDATRVLADTASTTTVPYINNIGSNISITSLSANGAVIGYLSGAIAVVVSGSVSSGTLMFKINFDTAFSSAVYSASSFVGNPAIIATMYNEAGLSTLAAIPAVIWNSTWNVLSFYTTTGLSNGQTWIINYSIIG